MCITDVLWISKSLDFLRLMKKYIGIQQKQARFFKDHICLDCLL